MFELNVNSTHLIVDTSNKNERLIGEYMVPPVIENRSSITYPTFG